MQLPESDELDISRLAAVFSDTTNSYKFYWFLAILDSLRDNRQTQMSIRDLSLRMVALVWYPLDYFKLSFGKQDGFKPIADYVSQLIVVDNTTNSPPLFDQLQGKLSASNLTSVNRMVYGKARYVPYRFVRPFLDDLITVKDEGDNIKNAVIELSNSLFFSNPERVMYRFLNGSIELSETWKSYFQRHQGILRGFTYWHLVRYLQKNNPNVTGLTEKLYKPAERDLKLAGQFWKEFLSKNPGLSCIYSGQTITAANLSLDHFLPWSFVAHDQLWNIIPTPKSVNSSKGDRLPSLDLYFDSYARMQYDGFSFYVEKDNQRILEDYHILFAQGIKSIQQQSFADFKERLSRQILPQLQTAQNLGFPYPFIYRKS